MKRPTINTRCPAAQYRLAGQTVAEFWIDGKADTAFGGLMCLGRQARDGAATVTMYRLDRPVQVEVSEDGMTVVIREKMPVAAAT